MKRILIVLVIALGAFAAWWFVLRAPALPEDSVRTLEEQRAVPRMTFTENDLARHNVREDCWMALNGVVYDATALVAGNEAYATACGTDATAFIAGRTVLEQDEIQTTLFAGTPLGTFAQ